MGKDSLTAEDSPISVRKSNQHKIPTVELKLHAHIPFWNIWLLKLFVKQYVGERIRSTRLRELPQRIGILVWYSQSGLRQGRRSYSYRILVIGQLLNGPLNLSVGEEHQWTATRLPRRPAKPGTPRNDRSCSASMPAKLISFNVDSGEESQAENTSLRQRDASLRSA